MGEIKITSVALPICGCAISGREILITYPEANEENPLWREKRELEKKLQILKEKKKKATSEEEIKGILEEIAIIERKLRAIQEALGEEKTGEEKEEVYLILHPKGEAKELPRKVKELLGIDLKVVERIETPSKDYIVSFIDLPSLEILKKAKDMGLLKIEVLYDKELYDQEWKRVCISEWVNKIPSSMPTPTIPTPFKVGAVLLGLLGLGTVVLSVVIPLLLPICLTIAGGYLGYKLYQKLK